MLRRLRGEAIGLFSGAGLLGVVWGTVIVVGAVMLYIKPQRHIVWGAIVIVFSVLSWIGTLGGLFVGFILGLVGGILGIVWKPQVARPAHQSPLSPPTRTCPNCGTVMYTDAKYCPKCGKELP